jgi:hypothetical protein
MTSSTREWGRTPIVGGRHAFRQSILLRELRRRVSETVSVPCNSVAEKSG